MEALVCWGKIVKCVLGRLEELWREKCWCCSLKDEETRTNDIPAWFGQIFLDFLR